MEITKRETFSVLETVKGVSIHDSDSLQFAVELLKKVVDTKKRVEDFFKPQLEATHNAWKTTLAKKNEYMGPLLEAEKHLKSEKSAYDREQLEIIRAEREKIELAARKKEEQIKKRLTKKLKKSSGEKAALIEEEMESIHVMREAPQTEFEKCKGVSYSKSWDIDVVDLRKLISAIANNKVNIDVNALFTVKKSTLKKFVSATGAITIPGCVIKESIIQRVS